jgi:hypothetical protein
MYRSTRSIPISLFVSMLFMLFMLLRIRLFVTSSFMVNLVLLSFVIVSLRIGLSFQLICGLFNYYSNGGYGYE